MEYYLTMKNNEVLIHAPTCMDLENTMLSERNQSQNITYYYMNCPEEANLYIEKVG